MKRQKSRNNRPCWAVKFGTCAWIVASMLYNARAVCRPVASLEHQGWQKSFLRGAQIFQTMSNSFQLCPTHFSWGTKTFAGVFGPLVTGLAVWQFLLPNWKFLHSLFYQMASPLPFFELSCKETCWYVRWPRERQWLHQCLSLAVVRGNGASILACVQVWSDFCHPQCINQCCCPSLATLQWTTIACDCFALSVSPPVQYCFAPFSSYPDHRIAYDENTALWHISLHSKLLRPSPNRMRKKIILMVLVTTKDRKWFPAL